MDENYEYLFCTCQKISALVDEVAVFDKSIYKRLCEVLQKVSEIKPRKKRANVKKEGSYGDIIKRIETAIAHAYFIENIIMFIPFGFLAPMVFERMRKVRFCVFIGFLCSCGIELSQLITQRGYCQLDDVVTNTVGMLVGWGIWKMLSSVGIVGNPLF